jgi:hypothetical protein
MERNGWARAGVVAAGLIPAVALFGGCSAAVSSPTPAALAVAPTVAPSPLPPTPKPTSIPVNVVPPPSAPPTSTVPPARAWSTAGITLDLPEGWSDPPGGYGLVIIAALDQIGDPPAGLYSMMLSGQSTASGAFVFRQARGARANAGLRVLSIAANGRSLREIVDERAAAIAGETVTVTRSRVRLAFGVVPFLEWDQPIRWGSLHMRAYFFGLGTRVVRVDVGTGNVPARSLKAELRRILESVRRSDG